MALVNACVTSNASEYLCQTARGDKDIPHRGAEIGMEAGRSGGRGLNYWGDGFEKALERVS